MQACNHAALYERTLGGTTRLSAEDSLLQSGKLKAVLLLLVKLTRCGRKVLLFSSMPALLNEVVTCLEWWNAKNATQKNDHEISFVRIGGITVPIR